MRQKIYISNKHTGIFLWRFLLPSRSYGGLHLQAKDTLCRSRFCHFLKNFDAENEANCRLGEANKTVFSEVPWEKQFYPEAIFLAGGDRKVSVQNDMMRIQLPTDARLELVQSLEDVSFHNEQTFHIAAKSTEFQKITIWWDIE